MLKKIVSHNTLHFVLILNMEENVLIKYAQKYVILLLARLVMTIWIVLLAIQVSSLKTVNASAATGNAKLVMKKAIPTV